MFRLHNHPICWGVTVFWGEGEREFRQHKRKQNLQFYHGKVLAQTSAGPDAEWHVHVWELARTNYSICKPCWVELMSIWPPNAGILMQFWNWAPNVGVLWNVDVSKFHLLQGFPGHKCGWRV